MDGTETNWNYQCWKPSYVLTWNTLYNSGKLISDQSGEELCCLTLVAEILAANMEWWLHKELMLTEHSRAGNEQTVSSHEKWHLKFWGTILPPGSEKLSTVCCIKMDLMYLRERLHLIFVSSVGDWIKGCRSFLTRLVVKLICYFLGTDVKLPIFFSLNLTELFIIFY